MRYIKILLASLSLITILNFTLAPQALAITPKSETCQALHQLSATNSCTTTGGDTIKSIAKTVVSILGLILGVISVIMIIFAGLRFVTAGGDTNAVSSAKNTLIYALIGLAIAVLAEFLAQLTLNTATNIKNSTSSGYIVNARQDKAG